MAATIFQTTCGKLCILFSAFLLLVTGAEIPRPQNFYGSEALLDGYCDEAHYFIDAFTLATDRLTVEGLADDVTQKLNTIVDTAGQ